VADLEGQLAGHDLVGLDTSIFIYHLENHPRYRPLTGAILGGIERGDRSAVASTVALMELTVHPWRIDRPMIARQYETLLVHFPNLRLADVTREVARRAAQLRARYDVRPADALHLATALVHEATAYLTNDKALTRIEPLLAVLVLDDFA
jgi:predicted nucleic acid-binding protein